MESIGTIILGFIAAALGAWLAVMLLDGIDPYEYDTDYSKVLPNPAKMGDTVTVEWKIKVNRICPGTTSRVLRDAKTNVVVAVYDEVPIATNIGYGDTKVIRTFPLPTGLTGEVKYRSTLCFKCNFVQKFIPLCMQTPELPFRITD